jgi:hypothetical protein
MDDKLWEQRIIQLPELVNKHNESTHRDNFRMMDVIAPPWMKLLTSYDNPHALG